MIIKNKTLLILSIIILIFIICCFKYTNIDTFTNFRNVELNSLYHKYNDLLIENDKKLNVVSNTIDTNLKNRNENIKKINKDLEDLSDNLSNNLVIDTKLLLANLRYNLYRR